MVYCRSCAAQIHESAPVCPKCGAPQQSAFSINQKPRTFANSIAICMNHYFDGHGRAPRSEYWYFSLFATLLGAGAGLTDAAWLGPNSKIFSEIINIALLIPSLAVWTRRMHDLDRSGRWVILWFIPVIGWVIALIWTCTPGTRGPNRYGPDPLGFFSTTLERQAPAE